MGVNFIVSLDFDAKSAAKPNAKEQSQFLLHTIQRAGENKALSLVEKQKVAELENACRTVLASNIDSKTQLSMINDKIRHFIPEIEVDHLHTLISHFQENGLYRMFYHKARIKGERNTSNLSLFLKLGFVGIALAALAVTFFAVVSALAAPAWLMVIANGLFASAMVYLSAISYGIINDIYATHANLPYFLFGHQPQQHSLIETNDPIAQGIAWGVAATFEPAAIAATIFGIATTITASFVPVANVVFPIALTAMPLLARQVDQHAQKNQQERLEQFIDFPEESLTTGSNAYQKNASMVLYTKKAEYTAYRANSDRNSFGFEKVPLMGVGLLGTMVTLSAAHAFLPTFLFSAAATTLLPVAIAGVGIILVSSAGIYTYVNRNKQIDNRFKLAFDQELDADLDELYLDQDLMRIQEFTQKQTPVTSPALIQEIKSVTRYFEMKAAQKADVELDNVQPGPSHRRTQATLSA